MHFEGVSGLDEIAGKTVGVFLFPLRPSVDALPAEVVVKDGQAFIDVLPLRKGKHVWLVPEDSVVSAAKDPKSPWPYAIFIRESSDTGRLLADAFRKASLSRN